VAELAEERRHHPDIDIRYSKVTRRLSSHDVGGVTARDIGFAEAVGSLT
jgi:4a-hydroxytetrahydrobiopterin dehydratase